jgi:molybdopterin-binding protein
VRDRAAGVMNVSLAGVLRPDARMPLVLVAVVRCHAHELATRLTAGQTAKRQIGAGMRLSARNKISATVTGITKGEATANVALDAGGVRLVASITVEAAEELGLAEGTQVIAIVKASDVIVAVPD